MTLLDVAVLMGGSSSEREVSLSTGRQVMEALASAGHRVRAVDAAVVSDVVALAEGSDRPDVVFIALHGRGGEDGTLQGLLEILGLPYTGSRVLASAIAMDKAMTKHILRGEDISVPSDLCLHASSRPAAENVSATVASALGFPCIVKPNTEGSTVGCTIVREPGQMSAALDEAFRHDTTVLVEQYIAGVEITVGVLGNDDPQALPIIEIVPKAEFYDYESKYAAGGSEHIIPARISAHAAERACQIARRCHTLLGCRGMSRTDMMVVGDQPTVLEVNTIPGMTPTSLLPDAARAAGMPFEALLEYIIECALVR